MKLYFFGLLLLYLFSTLNRAIALYLGAPTAITVQYAADVVVFALCLRVCFGMAFNRRFFTPESVRLIYWGVMALGILSAGILTKGELVGLPDIDIHFIDLLLWLLPYPLFALPCILLEKALKADLNNTNNADNVCDE